MKTKFTSFFNYLFSLLVVLTLIIGNVWGADQNYTITNPSGPKEVNATSGISVVGTYQSSKKIDNNNQKVFEVTSSIPLIISSSKANIKGIDFDIVYSSNAASGTANELTIQTSSSAAFLTPTTGFTCTVDNDSKTSLSALPVKKQQVSHTDVTVTFTSAVNMVAITKSSSNNYWIKNLKITYDDAITLPDLYATITPDGDNSYSITTGKGSMTTASITGSKTETVDGATCYQLGGANTYAPAENLVAGDIVVFTVGRSSSKTLGIKCPSSASAIVINKGVAGQLYEIVYKISSTTSTVTFDRNSSDTYLKDIKVYHTSSVTPSCTTPTIAWATGSTANISVLNELEATNLGINVTEYTGNITWALSGDDIVTLSNQSKTGCTVTGKADAYGTATLTASFTLSGDATLCDGTYSVTKTITIKECVAEPAALTNEIARFQVPCDVDNTQVLTSPINRTECTCTFAGVGGSGNWYQNPTSKLWYGKMNGDGTSKYITITLTSGSFQAGDVVTIAINRDNTTKSGFKIKSTSGNTVEPASTASGVEATGTYTLTADDINNDGSLTFYRSNSSTYVNRIIITRPVSCAATVPGNISKGEASGGTGTITLTAAGSPVSGDTWYWQSAADGVDKTGTSGATKSVSAAGTYYIRSYNTSGDCWSDAKNVTVDAADLLTAISPTLSYATSNIVVGNTSSPTLEGNTGSGSVSYALNDVSPAGSLTINSSNGVVTAVTVGGTATVTASIAANGNYAAGAATSETITVVADPVGSGHVLTWNLAVNTGETSISTTSKSSTSTYVTVTNLANESLTITSAAKDDFTSKIEAPASKNNSKYMYVTFTVADGYEFEPTAVDVNMQAVSAAATADLYIVDGNETLSNEGLSVNKGSATHLAIPNASHKTFSGTVTMKMYCYGSSVATYRFGTPITITGTVSVAATKYNLTFAKGDEGASGSMSTLQYVAGAEVTLPACTFTHATKEFDGWVVTKTVGGASVTVTDGKFTMPAEAVTATATWRTPAAHYTITYDKGANGTGSIAAGDKTEDVAFTLSAERFTRDGYVQTGWAESDGGAKAYNLGGSYTANAAITLYPVWTALDTYTASFACSASAPAGWTFSTDASWADNKTIAAYVCKFVENSIGTPKTTTGDGTSDDDVAFAKNTNAIATYDLGAATTVAALNVTLCGGSSSAFDQTIEYLGSDGSTVKKTYTTSLSAGNWKDNAISKTDIVDDVRYIRVHGASKWVVMKSFSVKYIETRTKYNVSFAPGTGASGSMDAVQYVAGAEVTLPASTFTAPTGKEFDAWTSSDVTITDNKFTMPASNVTVTATWKDAVTRYTVAYYDGASKLGDEDVEAGENPADYASYQTKSGYVFEGWFNNSDLAPAHAVADISAEVINADANYYGKWALDLQVTKIVFSNGFEAFINNGAVAAYYMSGESAPTISSYEGTNLKAEGGVTISGDKIVLTGTDDSEKELDLTLAAVTPMSSYDKQTFDGSETYVKAGLAFDDGWRFRKNASDGRIAKGLTRIYLFVGGGADKVTFTSIVQARAVKIYVNNVETSVTSTAAAGSTFDVPLDPNDANNMIAIVSNQTSGDGGVSDMKLNEHIISSDASLSSLTVNGNAVDLASGKLVDGVMTYKYELPYGTEDAPTVAAVKNNEFASLGTITQAASTTGTATFTVTAEDESTQAYTVKFSVSRIPNIVIWDGSTMSAVKTSPDASGLSWAHTDFTVSSFSAKTCGENGKSYTKALDFGGKTSASRQFSITVPEDYFAKVTLVYRATGTGRSIMISSALSDAVDENTITSAEAVDGSNLYIMRADFGEGTLFINTTSSYHVHEISVQLYHKDVTREVSPKTYGTICLPNGGNMVGATLFEVAHMTYQDAQPYKVFFDEVIDGVMEAGMPYIFLPKDGAEKIAVTYTDEANASAGNKNGLHGTLSLMDGEALYGKYIFYNNSIFMSENPQNWLNENRAYIVLSEVPDFVTPLAPGRKRVSMSVSGKNTPTGLDEISQEPRANSQKLLINGQLFILRGEKMYDATGRLVK